MATVLILSQTAGIGVLTTALTTTRTVCAGFIVQASPSNNSPVFIGDNTTNSTNKVGIQIPAPSAGVAAAPILIPPQSGGNAINLADYFVSSVTAGQAVVILFQTS